MRRRGGGRSRAAAKRRRPSAPRLNREQLEKLEQRQLDVIGLSLIAVGVYLTFVLYLGWDGGRVGSGIEDGLTYLFGKVAYVAPLVMFGCGAALICKPFLPAIRPLRTGGICIVAGLLLALAAGTAHLGPDHPLRAEYFDPSWFPNHGGLAGECLYWAASTLFQRVGAHIIALFLIFAGGLLLTGTSIATFMSGTGKAIIRARATSAEMARTVAQTAWQKDDAMAGMETEVAATDVMSDYPEEDLEPTVRVVEFDHDPEPELPEAGVPESEAPTDELAAVEVLDGDDAGEEAKAVEAKPGDEVPAPGENQAQEAARTPMGEKRGATISDEIDYKPPPPKVLEKGKADKGPDPRDHEAIGKKLVETLGHFGVEAKIVGIVSGPHVSRYELRLAPGTKVKKVTELSNDLAYALASTDIRILAPIPGKQAVGVEVPNARRRLVRLGDIYQGRPAKASPLVGWLGKDIAGNAVWTDLQKMPHVLVAGTTGSGKSGCINAVLSSILMGASPNEVRMVLVDPKRVELNHYENITHLLTPMVTSPRLAANVLANLIGEMENRYGIMAEARCRNLGELNRARKRVGEAPLPHVLCVIDELADLMMVAPAEVEDSIIRLAQKSRATGIHLVLATQRPSTDIITGTIKVNIPARIAFAVSSQTDSRVILDQGGAEALLGQGDMLFRPAGTSKLQRIQGAFVTEEEIARITAHWSKQGEPEFDQELLEARPEPEGEADEGDFDPDQDDLLDEAIHLVVQTQTASVSMLQRRLRVGYTRAGRLIDMLERRGVISGYEGSKPRQVLISEADLQRVLSSGPDAAAPDPEPVTSSPESA
ncbi:MAG: DNA translocase FtsK 4TM domain-containing protein [Solirubrobacterales bacterium]